MCIILEPSTENIKKCWDKLFWICGLRFFNFCFNYALNILRKKSFFKNANFNYLSKKLFFQSIFTAQIRFFSKNLRPHFQNSFVPIFFYVFCPRLKNKTQKIYWNRIAVYFCLQHKFKKKLPISGHFCCFPV